MKKILSSSVQKILFAFVNRTINRNRPEILGITGSFAKTTAKEMIFSVLSRKFKNIGKSYGNLNTKIGLPLSIFGYQTTPSLWQWPGVILKCWHLSYFGKIPKFLVLEIAADKPGDLKSLCHLLHPKYGVVTAIGPSHLLHFGKIGNVARDKSSLINCLPDDGVAFLNLADPLVKNMSKLANGEVVYYDGELSRISEAAATAVGRYFKIPAVEISQAIEKVKNQSSRLEIHKLPEKTWLIDDAYNANPLSMQAAFLYFSELAIEKKSKRKVAILGEMLELGDEAKKYHQEIGDIATGNFDLIIGVGENARCYKANRWFATEKEARHFCANAICPNDIVLVKGSHGVELQQLVKYIIEQKTETLK